MGQSPPSSTVNQDGYGMPFVQGNAEFGNRSPRAVKYCSRPKKQARQGDILLSVRAPVGALNLADRSLCIGRGLSAITATGVEAEFLWHALHQSVADLSRVSQGSTFAAVSKDDLACLKVPLPSLGEQRKIAAILSSVDDAIEKTQVVIDQVQVVKRGLMQELLTRGLPGRHRRFKRTQIGEIPEEWKVVRLQDVTARITDGVHKTPGYVSAGIPFLSVNNLRHGRMDFSGSKFVSEETHRELTKRCCPQQGDLLMGKVATLGVVDIVQTARPFSIFVQLALIRPTSRVSGSFLKWAIRDPKCQRQILASSSGTGMKYIGLGRIAELLVPLPSADEQASIASKLDSLETRIDAEAGAKDCLLVLKSALMSVLLTGELRVTPDPEPA